MKKRFVVIDANALIHRAYHALPRLTTRKGELVNAVYGFLLVFLKAIREFEPDYIAACFDLPGPTFRHKEFAEYKATRPKAPDELYEQIPRIKEILKTFSVPVFEKEGFEADDLIGTISKNPEVEKIDTIVLSGDLDTLQIVDENTKVYTLKRGVKDTILYDEEKVRDRYQISPTQLPDFKALVGDPSDNIPGVPGIGPKTASRLLKKFGNLENLYSALISGREISALNQRLRVKLEECKEQAFFSKMLAKLRYDVPIDFDLEKCAFGKYNKEKVVEIFKKLEFYTLIKRLDTPTPHQNKFDTGQASKKNLGRLF